MMEKTLILALSGLYKWRVMIAPDRNSFVKITSKISQTSVKNKTWNYADAEFPFQTAKSVSKGHFHI